MIEVNNNKKRANFRIINQNQHINAFQILQTKACSYRAIDSDIKELQSNLNNFKEYVHLFQDEETREQQKDFKEDSSISMEEQSTKNEDLDEIVNFLEGKKVNIYKNIINGFYAHINKCKDEKLIQKYESLIKNQWTFKYIQKRVQKSYKSCNRLNLKLKNLMSKNKLNTIFVYFLQNYEQLWLNDSKIKNKDLYKQSIQFLLKAHEYDILDDNIKVYKKQKKILGE
ncbi:hypothetical protein TTHERM_00094320 (macronuclear) [Tetrahymena thermophila SB210]|uniref:Uncharacterized protein n=1 Tax=Tetrahymena thermophila (strain SB210) TaxID=312017 RepID=Q235V9_TETTS|nr:hypothetical protein TTHERM_00094320 [Tetrahymena thermophila SB210]EAR92641.1 hypothetical protein TTHERM_00094320 [Tetrahymena thermophila SB210]|eukprot:XP_001012886.1 hypothetical protein TTHERM_00094320 [Tetrahymena thermophila SB210]